MKKIMLFIALFISLFTSTYVTAQENEVTQENNPYKRPELLLNKQLKVLPLEYKNYRGGYQGFKDPNTVGKAYDQIGITLRSREESLVGRIFTVKEVTYTGGDHKEDYLKSYRLTLEDQKGEVLYYNYNYEYVEGDNYYPFEVVGGLDLPADFYGDYIATDKSMGNGQTIYAFRKKGGFHFVKWCDEKKPSYISTEFLFSVNGDNSQSLKGKFKITLKNGTLIERDANFNPFGPKRYVATAILTKADIELLKANQVARVDVAVVNGPKGGIKLTNSESLSYNGVFKYLCDLKCE